MNHCLRFVCSGVVIFSLTAPTKWLVLLSELDPFGCVTFGQSRRATQEKDYIHIQVNGGLNQKFSIWSVRLWAAQCRSEAEDPVHFTPRKLNFLSDTVSRFPLLHPRVRCICQSKLNLSQKILSGGQANSPNDVLTLNFNIFPSKLGQMLRKDYFCGQFDSSPGTFDHITYTSLYSPTLSFCVFPQNKCQRLQMEEVEQKQIAY